MVAATALGLLVWNNLVGAGGWHARHYVSANLTATATLLMVAGARGVSADELGLSPDKAAAGARRGLVISGLVTAALATAALSPRHRQWLEDARIAGMSNRAVAYHAAVRIPLGTVVWEETAFRAVLPVLLRRVMPVSAATAANSVLFGLWHVRPTLDALRLNGAPTGATRRSAALVGALGVTALGDVLLSRLQRETGSLLAPALVHLASNSGGTIASAVASRGGDELRHDQGAARTSGSRPGGRTGGP